MKKVFFSNLTRTAILLAAGLAIVPFVFQLARTNKKIQYQTRVEDIKDIKDIKKYISLQFPDDASLVNGKLKNGLSIAIAAKIKMNRDDLKNFVRQDLLERNRVDNYTEIKFKESLVESMNWNLENVKFDKAFNGIVLTSQPNMMGGLWMIIQDEKSLNKNVILYIYYEV